MPRLILASASPRRREMLATLGVEFEAVSPEVDELGEGGPPEKLVVENARRKAVAGLRLADAQPGDVALGVDTEVVLERRVLGKAVDVQEARGRLLALSGRTHEVLSGVVLAQHGRVLPEDREEFHPAAEAAEASSLTQPDLERSGVARSLVSFRELDEATLEGYLASGEWRDRAGAYAIQGLGSLLVRRLEGDFSNVVGLPVQLLLELAPEWFSGISSVSGDLAEKSRSSV